MLYSDFFEKCIYRTIKMTTINKNVQNLDKEWRET